MSRLCRVPPTQGVPFVHGIDGLRESALLSLLMQHVSIRYNIFYWPWLEHSNPGFSRSRPFLRAVLKSLTCRERGLLPAPRCAKEWHSWEPRLRGNDAASRLGVEQAHVCLTVRRRPIELLLVCCCLVAAIYDSELQSSIRYFLIP